MDDHPVHPPPPESSGLPLLHNLTCSEIESWMVAHGTPPYRARQLWQWLYVHRCRDLARMTNLPATLRNQIADAFVTDPAHITETQGVEGDTRKLLLRLRDGEQVESVLIPAENRRTICVSCQAGCRFRCAFCASGQAGFRRNLEPGEILAQVLSACDLWQQPPTHVVFMGVGEPFDNYDAVLQAVRTLNDQDGFRIGARRITISTCGMVPGIERLAGEGIQVELSVSLHAPNNALRNRLMPVNQRYPMEVLMPACDAYTRQTGRIITFEYTLIHNLNDGPECARELARLLQGRPARVNLIPLSPVAEFPHAPPAPEQAERFAAILTEARINSTLRLSRGCALDAACGQLRYRPL